MFKRKPKKEVKSTKRRQFVVQIREVLDNKKFADSVTKYIGVTDANKIYELLEEK